jgi:hypothetical protein
MTTGRILALVTLVLAVLFVVLARLELVAGGLIILLALALLLP